MPIVSLDINPEFLELLNQYKGNDLQEKFEAFLKNHSREVDLDVINLRIKERQDLLKSYENHANLNKMNCPHCDCLEGNSTIYSAIMSFVRNADFLLPNVIIITKFWERIYC